MGIEAIGSIGRVASVAPAVGRGLGSIGRLGVPRLEGGFSVSKIANPFLGIPRAAPYIENRGPSLLGSRVEAIKNPFKVERGFSVASVIAEAESIVRKIQTPSVIARTPSEMRGTKQSNSEIARLVSDESERATLPWVARNDVWKQGLVKTPEPAVVGLPNPARGLDVRVITNPFLAAKVEAAPQSIVQTRAESRATSAVARATSTPTQKEVQTEQIMEEKKIESRKEDKPQEKRSEKQSVAKIKIVEAVKITQLRRSAVFEAARKVKEEAEKTAEKVIITGKKLKKFLSAEFWKYISPLVGRVGYDGTIPLTLNAIENNLTEYTNLEEAQTRLSQPVAEHIPLEKGEGGRIATVEEVREVLEGKEKENLRSNTPAEITIKRIVVKKNEIVTSTGQTLNTVVEKKEEELGEPTLKSLGLEEVFPKAA